MLGNMSYQGGIARSNLISLAVVRMLSTSSQFLRRSECVKVSAKHCIDTMVDEVQEDQQSTITEVANHFWNQILTAGFVADDSRQMLPT